MFRWIFTAVLIVLAFLFWLITLTIPTIAATAPALIAIVLTVAVWYFWPTRHQSSPKSNAQNG